MAAPSTRLGSQTFTSFADAHAIVAEWEALTIRLAGSMYSTFGWCRVWWRHYGDGRDLRVISVHDGGELVGVLPFFIDRLRTPFRRARIAKLVGSDSTPALVDPLLDTRVEAEAFALAMSQLFEEDRVDAVHLGPFAGASTHLDAIHRSAAVVTDVARVVRDRISGSHTVFTMPDGFDAYTRTLSKNHRSNYRRNLNKINTAFSFAVNVVRDPLELEPEFDAFVETHQAQWRAAGKLGHFGDWPESRAFSRDLVRALGASDKVRLIRLLADGQAVAYFYWCLALNGTYSRRLPPDWLVSSGTGSPGCIWAHEDDGSGGRRGRDADRGGNRALRLQGRSERADLAASLGRAVPEGSWPSAAYATDAGLRRRSEPRLLPDLVRPGPAAPEDDTRAAAARLDPPPLLVLPAVVRRRSMSSSTR